MVVVMMMVMTLVVTLVVVMASHDQLSQLRLPQSGDAI